MFELIKDKNGLQDGDILYLEKVNEYQTMKPIIKNVVIVNEPSEPLFENDLLVSDYGGYVHIEKYKGTFSAEHLFEKWGKVIRIGNIYSNEWKQQIQIAKGGKQ